MVGILYLQYKTVYGYIKK